MKIAVLMGGLLYDSQKSLLEGIRDYAVKNDVNVFVFTCGGDIYTVNDHNKGEFQIYSLPKLETYDGIIFAPETIQNANVVSELREELATLSVKTIVVDSRMEHAICFKVDNEHAMYKMAEHIIVEHNRKKLLYISGPKENIESEERKKGFLKCMEDYDLREGADYRIDYGDYWIDVAKNIVETYLLEEGMPEAVICANDYMAIGAAEELQNKGFVIPEDVIVTGFDNSYEGRYYVPRITSIEKPLHEMGYEACKRLVEGIKQEDTIFQVSCKYSESCGCSSEKNADIRDFKKRMTKEKNNNMQWAKILNSMSADLNELNTFTEFIDRLKQYVSEMMFPYFYLCLCEESLLTEEIVVTDGKYRIPKAEYMDYPSRIQVAIAYEKGRFYDPETIRTAELLPQRFYENAKGVLSVVVPVHFRLHCMGYCVVGDSDFPMETIQFQSWIMNLGNALENIRKQMLMQSMIDQLNKMWIYDTMTGVLNRAGFYIKAEEVINKCKTEKSTILLLFMDIDKLKIVNDTYGHEEGDFYIKTVARACQKSCGEHGVVMRYGGDEFVLLGETHEKDYKIITENIQKEVKRVMETEKKPYKMSVSIGHYISSIDDEFKLDSLIEKADKEMYGLKKAAHSDSQNI